MCSIDISPLEMELAVFDLLSSGCATYPELKNFLNNRFKDHDKTNDSNEGTRSLIADGSLFKFLSQLRKSGLIQSARYFDRKKRRNFTLYANTESSVEVLIREFRYRRNHIRSPYLPGRFAFWHDMDLTRVTRRIKDDGPAYLYHFGFEDEFALRRSKQKAKKGDMYPDLNLAIKTKDGGQYFFRIEVQRYRDRLENFASKLAATRNNLVLCTDRELIYDIEATHVYLRDNALFALIDDFAANGLFRTKWLSSAGQIVGLIYNNG